MACRWREEEEVHQVVSLQPLDFLGETFHLEEHISIIGNRSALILVQDIQEGGNTSETESRAEGEQKVLHQADRIDSRQQYKPEPKYQVDELEVEVPRQFASRPAWIALDQTGDLTGEDGFAAKGVHQPDNAEADESTAH